jgi:hypothetical protein
MLEICSSKRVFNNGIDDDILFKGIEHENVNKGLKLSLWCIMNSENHLDVAFFSKEIFHLDWPVF